MSPLRQLLTATDLSPASQHAIDRGFLLAREQGAGYTLLHALGLDVLAPLRRWLDADLPDYDARARDEALAALRAMAADPARAPGIRADVRVESGAGAPAALAAADDLQADLVLIGAAGAGGARHLLQASTAHRLLRQCQRPILVVREAPQGPWRRVLVPVDFSPASRRCVEMALRVAPGAELMLVHVMDVAIETRLRRLGLSEMYINRYRIERLQEAQAQLQALGAAAGKECRVKVLHGVPAVELVAEAARHDCDLIVIGKHGILVTEDLLLGSTTLRILEESHADVLVVVDERRAPLRDDLPG